MSKYTPLEKFLTYSKTYNTVLKMSFVEIEKIVGEALPESAYQDAAWWTNEEFESSSQTAPWARAGWKVDGVNFEKKRVTFSVAPLAPRIHSRF